MLVRVSHKLQDNDSRAAAAIDGFMKTKPGLYVAAIFRKHVLHCLSVLFSVSDSNTHDCRHKIPPVILSLYIFTPLLDGKTKSRTVSRPALSIKILCLFSCQSF